MILARSGNHAVPVCYDGLANMARVAQWIERRRPKAGVGGSNPSSGTGSDRRKLDGQERIRLSVLFSIRSRGVAQPG